MNSSLPVTHDKGKQILINLARRLRMGRQYRKMVERIFLRGSPQWHAALDVEIEAWNSFQAAKQIYFNAD